ncbi:unnamed protein product [Larinioides sclopetarius]|uniref:Uncharacterized protein n=2 Tax=Larinioides sclopetarius TaxID=280406 RepID=A0AAV2ADG7_9ARAC
MVRRRSSLVLRNKKGHPIYSREDIREQYCINRKEVEVLENARSIKLFGCLSHPQESSPCAKNSLLFSCIHKKKHHKSHHQHRRSSSDENVYAPEIPSPSPYDTDRTIDTDDTKSKDLDICSTDDEEYVLSGFRKRPKTIYCDPNRSRDSDAGSFRGRRKLESSASFGSQQSYEESERECLARNARRPSQLYITRGGNERFQNSRSVDELNDSSATRRREVVDTGRVAKTPDISLDDRRQKHVSFDNGSMVRSNTVAGGLEEVGGDFRGGPAATSTPLSSQRRTFSPPPRRNRSQERLLDGFVTARPPLEFSDRPTSVASYRYQDFSSSYRLGSLQHRPRRALMKTQATQTELTFKARFLLPAYLTLSPRAHTPQLLPVNQYPPCQRPPSHRSRSAASRYRTTATSSTSARHMSKSQSAHNTLGSDDSDDEVMEVDLSTKQQRLIRSTASRASIRRQKAVVEEEIMVSYKPAPSPPKGNVEVLIGDRPVSRTVDREHRKISSIARETTPIMKHESQEDFLERSNAVEITIRKCKITPPEPEKRAKDEAKATEKVAQKSVPRSQTTEKVISPKDSEELRKTSSEEKPSPEESSEVSGMRSPSKREMGSRGKTYETLESSSAMSSSESSRHAGKLSQPEFSSSAEGSCSCQDYGSFEESQTFTTDESLNPEIRQALESAERRRQEYLDKYREVKSKSESRRDDPTSPDSESSSSIFTERETSRSEVSTSSSNRVAKSETEEEESSEYVTATDHSPHSPQRTAIRKKGPSEDDDVPTSFESFSSPSKSSGYVQAKSSGSSPSLLQDGISIPLDQQPEGSPRLTADADDASIYLSAALPPDDLESSDESTKKETPPTTPSTESEEGHTPFHKMHHDTSGTPDSDRTSDITALFDPSPEPLSSLQEPQTVIEIRSEATSEEILSMGNDDDELDKIDDEDSFPRGNGSRSDRGGSESSESSSVLSGLQDMENVVKYGGGMERLQMGSYVPLDIRKADELSTVSEVSEESSKNGMIRVRKKKSDRKASEASSISEDHQSRFGTPKGALSSKRSSSSEYIPSETTTPDSTTSGSFVLDNGSCTENGSYNSLSNHDAKTTEESSSQMLGEESKGKNGSKTRTESESASESYKESKSSKTPLPPDEDSQGRTERSDGERHLTSSPAHSAASDLSEKLVSLTLSSSSSVSHKIPRNGDAPWERNHYPNQALSAWCSEGAIPKQKHPEEGRRRKDRLRNRSEPREHVTSLQFSRAERSKSRSKSRSPENKLSDEETGPWFRGRAHAPLCSHCGGHAPPRSAPPDWDRGYPRFWEGHGSHQPMMWRQREYRDPVMGYSSHGRYSGTSYSQSHCHVPRSWSSDSSSAGPPAMALEMEVYPDEDEDAGVYSETYRASSWIYISDADELAVWKQHMEPREESDSTGPGHPSLQRADSTESTSSEHEFLKQYEIVTHRMIQRKCSVEMYKRLAHRTFEVDKRITVQRNNGEFGFKIHGNRPVVVSSIEKGTSAETSGLEVGDIIISINGLNVLEAPHGDVVRLAHTGTDVLKMEVCRTIHVLAPVLNDLPPPPVYSGYLQRLSARSRRWCRRWFAVKLDGVLYWYRSSKHDHEPLGALALQNQTISRVPEAGAPHAFKVSKFGESPYYFSADDEDTATRWISALNQVAATASRVDPYVDESLRNAQLPSISIPNVDCEGPLSKYSNRWKTWRRRYFLLKDASLYFYTDRNAKVALGLFQLHGYKVQSSSCHGQKNAFEAVPPEPRYKYLYFLADTENEKKRWLSALDYSIDRWIKIG